jgi:hypothetical protein
MRSSLAGVQSAHLSEPFAFVVNGSVIESRFPEFVAVFSSSSRAIFGRWIRSKVFREEQRN